MGDSYFEIETEWMVRQCSQTSTYALPGFVVNAPDPVAAAREWKRTQEIHAAGKHVIHCEEALARARKRLDDAMKAPL